VQLRAKMNLRKEQRGTYEVARRRAWDALKPFAPTAASSALHCRAIPLASDIPYLNSRGFLGCRIHSGLVGTTPAIVQGWGIAWRFVVVLRADTVALRRANSIGSSWVPQRDET